jgi:hypothetical protein
MVGIRVFVAGDEARSKNSFLVTLVSGRLGTGDELYETFFPPRWERAIAAVSKYRCFIGILIANSGAEVATGMS